MGPRWGKRDSEKAQVCGYLQASVILVVELGADSPARRGLGVQGLTPEDDASEQSTAGPSVHTAQAIKE